MQKTASTTPSQPELSYQRRVDCRSQIQTEVLSILLVNWAFKRFTGLALLFSVLATNILCIQAAPGSQGSSVM